MSYLHISKPKDIYGKMTVEDELILEAVETHMFFP